MADSAATSPRSRGHETADVSGRRIAWVAVGLMVTLIVVAFAALMTHGLLRPARPSIQAPTQAVVASAPHLQTAPASDLDALRAQKHAMLDQYRWLDRGKGVVQIPIERAMQLTVERSAEPSTTTRTDTKKTAEPAQ